MFFYAETIRLTDRKKHEGLTLEAVKGATLQMPKGARQLVTIQDVPHVRLSGFKCTDPGGSRDAVRAFVVVSGTVPGVALTRLANAYGSECDRVRQDLGIAVSQLRDYKVRLGKPFFHDAYLSELTILRDQLKVGLSITAHPPDNEDGPTVSDLADKIKALKATHSIEATP